MNTVKQSLSSFELTQVDLYSISSRLVEKIRGREFINFAQKVIDFKPAQTSKTSVKYDWVTHPFLMVERTWMPFILGNFVFFLLFNLVSFFHKGVFLFPEAKFFLPLLLISIFIWIYGICVDSLFLKNRHTREVQLNYLTGVSLFILSEIMVFFGFFWAFFHSALNPSFYIGNVWPPVGIEILNPWGIPFLNTIILLFSGVTVNIFYYNLKSIADNWKMVLKTRVHKLLFDNIELDLPEHIVFNNNITNYLFVCQTSCLKNQNFSFKYEGLDTTKGNIFIQNNFDLLSSTKTFFEFSLNYHIIKLAVSTQVSKLLTKFSCINQALVLTQTLGALFLLLQIYEYIHASFTITDSVYGSVFYMLTGLHGSHVFIGLLLLIVDLILIRNILFWVPNVTSHVFVTFTVWYWHFVDIVWIFVFSFVYVWGN